MRELWKLLARSGAFLTSAAVVIGCSVAPVAHQSTTSVPTPGPAPSTAPAIRGLVHGGQWPVKGAQVYLLAASAGGYGQQSTSLISGTNANGINTWNFAPTDGNGNFTIANGTWGCTPGQEVYLYSVGGDSVDQPPTINNANLNAAAGLMALLGECGASNSLSAVTGFIKINEITTVAAAYALSGFATDPTKISGPATGQGYLGLQNAVKNAAMLADINTGDVPANLPSNVTVPTAMIYTLADILADCVNAQTNLAGNCPKLMSDETFGSSVPTDTAWAAINMAKQPGANVSDLYGNMLGNQVFQPIINTGTPTDFAIGIGFSGGGLAAPTAIAIDASGNAWVTDTPTGHNGGVVILGPQGNVVTQTNPYTCGDTLTAPTAIALAPSSQTPETAWVISSSAAAVNGIPYGGGSCTSVSPEGSGAPATWTHVASIAASDKLYVVDQGLLAVESFVLGSGSSASGSSSWSGPFNNPDAVALDGAGNVWVADETGGLGSANLYAINSTGTYIAASGTGFGTSPNTMAVGAGQSLWVADQGSDKVYPFSTVVTPTSATATVGTPFSDPAAGVGLPLAVVVDGVGNTFVANENGADIAAFSADGMTALSPNGTAPHAAPFGGYSGNGIVMPSDTSIPTGIAVDPSGDVWLSVQGGTSPVVEFIGMGAPTVTPLADAVVGNKIATRP